MSAQVWPPISPSLLIHEIASSLAAELQWLLSTLQETLVELKSGLEECIALLAPKEPGSTLVLSSLRSEVVKGWVTRVGGKVVKGDIHLRLATLPPPRPLSTYPLHLVNSLPLPQLSRLLNLLNQCLDIIDITTWTGDSHDASFIAGQLRLLADTIDEAKQTLIGGEDVVGGKWWEDVIDGNTFKPPLPHTLSFHLSVSSASLVLHIRTLSISIAEATASFTGLSIRSRLGLSPKPPDHDEVDQTFGYRGENVTVKEKVRVESQDPSLMAVMAKLSALGHGVAVWRCNLAVVMGVEDEAEGFTSPSENSDISDGSISV